MEDHTNSNRSHVSKNKKHSYEYDSHRKHGSKHDLSKHHIKDLRSDDQDSYSSGHIKNVESQNLRGEHFVSDKKGDLGILQYGSNHSYEVPPYRRMGYGLVLGLSRFLKIDRESTDKEIGLISSVFSGNKRDKAIFAKVARAKEDTVWPSQTDSLTELDKDYLTLENERQKDSYDSADDSDDSDSPDYRSTIRKAKVNNTFDDNLEALRSISRVEISSSIGDMTWSRRVESDPSDAQAWLELIKQQTLGSSTRQTRAERSSLADIKLSMYGRALKHVIGPMREDLLRGLLKEAYFVWDEAKIQRKWEDTLRDNRQSFGLWKDYLDYRQTKSIRFRFDDLRTVFKEAFLSLQLAEEEKNTNVITKNSRPRSTRAEIGLHALYTLLRYTTCLRQAGYIEQAIAIWQVTLESHFYGTSVTKSEEAIESFWESEVSRIGESNARGLAHYIENGGDAPAEQEDPPKPVSKALSIKIWLNYEKDVLKLLPARTLDGTDEEDVFRVILFPDVQPFLLHKFEVSSESVIDAFLLFNGLPPLWQDETESWANDPFLYCGSPTLRPTGDSTQLDAIADQQAGLSCRTSIDTLFADSKSPLHCFKGTTEMPNTTDSRKCNLGFVRAVLRYLVDLEADSKYLKLIEYYLAFELQYYPQDARKISKSCLKKHPRALTLYNTHGLVEYRLGNNESARKTLETAMKMCSGDPEVILLRRTLAWESLEGGSPTLALEYLLGGSKIHDEATIFAIQQSLLEGMNRAVVDSQNIVLNYMDCLLLLGYLTNPDPLSASFAIFQSNLSFMMKLTKHTDILEMSHQSLARLLYYHMQHHQYKPSLIRKIIHQSIAAFPANTIFLSIFQLNEQRFRINDRIRSVVRDTLSNQGTTTASKSSPVVSYMFVIHAEMSRTTSLGSSVESIRSVFERAIEDDAMRNCPAIWHWYAEFELSQSKREKSSQKAQNVVFRAMTACPWVRDFYLMAIRYLDNAQDSAGVKGVYEMITERELRIRVPLEL